MMLASLNIQEKKYQAIIFAPQAQFLIFARMILEVSKKVDVGIIQL